MTIPDKDPTVELLRQGAAEIRDLRRQNELLDARLDMFDRIFLIFSTNPKEYRQGYAEDVARKMELAAESLNGRKEPGT